MPLAPHRHVTTMMCAVMCAVMCVVMCAVVCAVMCGWLYVRSVFGFANAGTDVATACKGIVALAGVVDVGRMVCADSRGRSGGWCTPCTQCQHALQNLLPLRIVPLVIAPCKRVWVCLRHGNRFPLFIMIMIIVVVVVVVVMLVLAVISHSMHVGSCRTCCPRCSLFRQVLLQQLKHTGCSSAVSLQQLFKQR